MINVNMMLRRLTILESFALALKSYRIGLLFTHDNGAFEAISVTERSWAARTGSLKWRVTYRIGVHTIVDSFTCRQREKLSGIVWTKRKSFLESEMKNHRMMEWILAASLRHELPRKSAIIGGANDYFENIPSFYSYLSQNEVTTSDKIVFRNLQKKEKEWFVM